MDLVLKEAMTALGCLVASPCVVLSLPQKYTHTLQCVTVHFFHGTAGKLLV